MGELVGLVFGLGIYGLIGYFIFYKLIYKTIIKGIKGTTSIFKLSKEEKGAFQQMMLSPTDETVSRYIAVLKGIADYSSKTPMSQSISMADQIKYTNAYNLVKDTGVVSKEKKEELYRMLLILGIPLTNK